MEGGFAMLDLLCIAITLILFAACASFTRGCDKLYKEDSDV
jgi:hypothetical protein